MPINIKHVKLIKAVAGTHAASSNRTAVEAYDDITSAITNPALTNVTGTFDYLTPLRAANVKMDSVKFLRAREESFDKSFLNSTICASRSLFELGYTPAQASNKLLDLNDTQIQELPASLKTIKQASTNVRSLVIDQTNSVVSAANELLSFDNSSHLYIENLKPWHLDLLSPAVLADLNEAIHNHQDMGEDYNHVGSIKASQETDSTNTNLLLQSSFLSSTAISTGGFAPALMQESLTGNSFAMTSNHNQLTVLFVLLIGAAVGGIAYATQRFFKAKHEGETFVPMTVTSSVEKEEQTESYNCCYRKSTNI